MTSATPKPRAGEHTKEPWRATFGDSEAFLKACVNVDVGHIYNAADARRVVACVNACGGVENAELEDLAALKCAIPGVAGIAQMAILNDTLEAENKELAEALGDLLRESGRGRVVHANTTAVTQARALLTKHGR